MQVSVWRGLWAGRHPFLELKIAGVCPLSSRAPRSSQPEFGCEPDLLEHLNAVGPQRCPALAKRHLAQAFLNVGRDGRVPDKIAVDKKVEALDVCPPEVGLTRTL